MNRGHMRLTGAALALMLSLAFAMLQAAPAAAQDKAAAEIRPRRVLAFFSLVGGGLDPARFIVLRESLLVALAGARSDIFVVEPEEAAPVSADDSARGEAARARGCDAWLAVSVGLAGEGLRIDRRIVDLAIVGPAAASTFDAPLPELRDLARDFWDETRDALTAALPPLPKSAAGLVVTGAPGSRLRGLGDAEIVLDQFGRAVLDLPIPAAFNLSAEAAGFYQLRESFLADQEGMTISLRQAPLPRFAVNVGLLGGYLTAGFSWFPLPARIFLRAELVSFLMGFQLASSQNDDGKDPPIFVSKKLVTFGLSAGSYLNGPDEDFRTYAGAGGGPRVMLGSVGGLEPIVPWQLSGLLGAEYSGIRKVKFYFEWIPLLYFPVDEAWFRAAAPRKAPYLRLFGGWLDPTSAVFGARFYL